MIPQPLAYTRLVGGFVRTLALLIAVATGFAPTVLDYCATTCETHEADAALETARASALPPCHRAATAVTTTVTTTTRVDHAPDGCGHDHHPSMATLTPERPAADHHAPMAAMPRAHDAFGPSVRIATATPSGPPGDVLPFAQRAVPLRI